MRKLLRRFAFTVGGLIALSVATMCWDIERVETLKHPLWAIKVPWSAHSESSSFIGLGYSVIEIDHYVNANESDSVHMREYELRHWFFPWRVAHAGS